MTSSMVKEKLNLMMIVAADKLVNMVNVCSTDCCYRSDCEMAQLSMSEATYVTGAAQSGQHMHQQWYGPLRHCWRPVSGPLAQSSPKGSPGSTK